jgi:hypothetical protein
MSEGLRDIYLKIFGELKNKLYFCRLIGFDR